MRRNVFFLVRNLEQEAAELAEKPATRLCFLRYFLFIIWLRPDGRAVSSASPREIKNPRGLRGNSTFVVQNKHASRKNFSGPFLPPLRHPRSSASIRGSLLPWPAGQGSSEPRM